MAPTPDIRDQQREELILTGLYTARQVYDEQIIQAAIAREDAARRAYQASVAVSPRRRSPTTRAMAAALGVSREWFALVNRQPMGTTIVTNTRRPRSDKRTRIQVVHDPVEMLHDALKDLTELEQRTGTEHLSIQTTED